MKTCFTKLLRAALPLLITILSTATAWAQQYTVFAMSTPFVWDAVQVSLDNQNWDIILPASAGETVYFKINTPIGYVLNGYSIESESGSVSHTSHQFTMPNSNVTVSANFVLDPAGSSINYTVILSPGEGTGNDITYYFDPASAAPNSYGENFQFYYINYTTIGFNLRACPDSFTAPANKSFNGWWPTYETLHSGTNTYTAQ